MLLRVGHTGVVIMIMTDTSGQDCGQVRSTTERMREIEVWLWTFVDWGCFANFLQQVARACLLLEGRRGISASVSFRLPIPGWVDGHWAE